MIIKYDQLRCPVILAAVFSKTSGRLSTTSDIVNMTCSGVSKTSSDVNEYAWVRLVAVRVNLEAV